MMRSPEEFSQDVTLVVGYFGPNICISREHTEDKRADQNGSGGSSVSIFNF
jgi:hypothetical protein